MISRNTWREDAEKPRKCDRNSRDRAGLHDQKQGPSQIKIQALVRRLRARKHKPRPPAASSSPVPRSKVLPVIVSNPATTHVNNNQPGAPINRDDSAETMKIPDRSSSRSRSSWRRANLSPRTSEEDRSVWFI
jgi:hypothetical protein